MTDPAIALPLEPSTDVGIGHRGQRMMLHAAFVQQAVGDEKMPLINRPSDLRKRRTDHGRVSIQFFGQRLTDRTDIAFRR